MISKQFLSLKELYMLKSKITEPKEETLECTVVLLKSVVLQELSFF